MAELLRAEQQGRLTRATYSAFAEGDGVALTGSDPMVLLLPDSFGLRPGQHIVASRGSG